MINKEYVAYLNGILNKGEMYLPLSDRDREQLEKLIPDGEEMYLILRDDLYSEKVLVSNVCGTLFLTRDVGGTGERKFPVGTCVKNST